MPWCGLAAVQLGALCRHCLRAVEYSALYPVLFAPSLWQSLQGRLVNARQALALFQHHDGITGTAKTAVAKDYGIRMLQALQASDDIMATALAKQLQMGGPVQ